MKIIRPVALLALSGLLLAASCAERRAEGPMVTLYEGATIRQVPAGNFNEAAYLKRGYIKNTDPQGNTIYVFIPKQDTPEIPAFRRMNMFNPWFYRDTTDRGGGGLSPGLHFLD